MEYKSDKIVAIFLLWPWRWCFPLCLPSTPRLPSPLPRIFDPSIWLTLKKTQPFTTIYRNGAQWHLTVQQKKNWWWVL